MAATIGTPAHSIVYHPEILRSYAESRILLVKRETELVMEYVRTKLPSSLLVAEIARVRADITEIDRQFRFKDEAKPVGPLTTTTVVVRDMWKNFPASTVALINDLLRGHGVRLEIGSGGEDSFQLSAISKECQKPHTPPE